MTQRQQQEEHQIRYSIAVVLLYVATNAFPQLGVELSKLAETATNTEQQQQGVADILAAHGGERFGEKDNRKELEILEPWLQQLVEKQGGPDAFVSLCKSPSLDQMLEIVLQGHARHSDWSIRRLDLATALDNSDNDCKTSRSLQDMLKQCWSTEGRQAAATVPSLVLVKGRTTVATLCDKTTIDFGSTIDSSTLQQERLVLEAARSQSAKLKVLQHSISSCNSSKDGVGHPTSCSSIGKALENLQQWLMSTKPVELQRTEGLMIHSSMLHTQISTHMATWQRILDRLENQQQTAQSTQRHLERHRTYVLRAFVAEHNGEFSVVRRFGKANISGHFSVLSADGVCHAVRLRDISGVVVESIWVCSSDDSECIAAAISIEKEEKEHGAEPGGTSQTGINTVVADPDDEIFCQLCGDFESWSYNQIVLCDACELGVHQMCHDPVVTENEVLQDEWFCGICRKKDDSLSKRQRTE
ncbi:mitochondrial transcription factor 2 [Coemansia sp. RSA 1365]|nr:mitochondrial transcription factor 2 [Coemansia sp. RSA 1365]